MEIAMVGLGRMGMNMLERLAKGGHTVYGFDTSPDKMPEVEKRGGVGVTDLARSHSKAAADAESRLDHGSAGQAGG